METFIYFCKASALLSLFLLIYKYLLSKESFLQVNRAYLLLGLVVSFGLPFVQITQVEVIEIEVPIQETFTYSLADYATVSSTEPRIIHGKEKSFQIVDDLTWTHFFLLIYGLGVLFFFGKLLHQSSTLVKLLKKANKTKINGIWHYQTHKPIETFSFFNLMAYHPTLHTKDELQLITTHEEVHIKQWHSVDMLLANIACMLLWFLPFAYFYRIAIDENLEYIADAATVQKTKLAKQYQYTLVNHLGLHTQMKYASYFFKQSSLKNRIIMLNKQKSSKLKLIRYSLIAPLLVTFIWFFQTKTVAKEVYIEVERPSIEEHSYQAQEKQKLSTAKLIEQDSTSFTALDRIEVKINKDATDESLADVEAFFAENDQKLKFSKIKRNKEGEITRIKIKLSDKQNRFEKETYVSGNEPMKEYVIVRDFKNNIADIKEFVAPEKSVYDLLNDAKVIFVNGNKYEKDKPLAITNIVIEKVEGEVLKINAEELEETNIAKIYELFDGEKENREVFILKDFKEDENLGAYVMRLEINKDNSKFVKGFSQAYKEEPILELNQTSSAKLSEETAKQLKEYLSKKENIQLNGKMLDIDEHKGKIIILDNLSFDDDTVNLVGELAEGHILDILFSNAFKDKLSSYIEIDTNGDLKLDELGKFRRFTPKHIVYNNNEAKTNHKEDKSEDLTSKREQIEKLYQKAEYVFIDGKKKSKSNLIDKVLLFKSISFDGDVLHFKDTEIKENQGNKHMTNILGDVLKAKEEINNLQVLWFVDADKVELAVIHKSNFKSAGPESSISYLTGRDKYNEDKPIAVFKNMSIDSTFILSKNQSAIQINGAVEIEYNEDFSPIFVLNGKVIDEKTFKKIKPTDIKSVHVFKNHHLLPDDLKTLEGVAKEDFKGLIKIELKDKDDFEITVTKRADGQYAMQCNQGCAWEELSFSLNSLTSQYVNAYGVKSMFPNENTPSKDSKLADFQFKVEKKKNLLQLTKLTGTNWEELSFKLLENDTYTLTTNGVFKND